MQSAKRKVQSVGTALQFVENICHSEEHSDEESLLVLLFTLLEILRYAQNDTIKQLDKLKFAEKNTASRMTRGIAKKIKLEKSVNFAFAIYIDFICCWHFWKSRHCHNVTCKCYYKACTSTELYFAYSHCKVFRFAKFCWVI